MIYRIGMGGLAALVFVASAWGQTVAPSAHVQQDIQRHRAMAAAHEGAARCLEAGKSEEVCQQALQAACKGLAIGKFCGMRHSH